MLNNAANQLEELLERIDDIYFTLDANFNITHLNKKAKQDFDIPSDLEEYGNLWDLLPEVASSFYRPLKESLTRCQVNEFKGYYPPTNKWFHAHAYADNEGGLAVFFRDITEQKNMENKLRDRDIYLCTLLNHLVDGVIAIDENGLIKMFNPSAEKLFGYSSDEIAGKNISVLMSENDAFQHNKYLKNYVRSNTPRIIGVGREILAKHKNGQTFPADLAVNTMIVDDRRYFIGSVRDISDRKKAEKELHHYREHLEQLVESRTQDLIVARDRALEANKSKSDFLANMSHELRTPLNAIIGYSEMIEEETSDKNFDSVSLDIRKIKASGKHLLSLINNILDLSKIEAGHMENYIEKFSVACLMGNIISSVESLLTQNNNSLKLTVNDNIDQMESDVTKVRQIMFNLISNANKFTENGLIDIHVLNHTFDELEWITIEVTDTGIGMSKEQMDQLFKPFVQGDNSTTRKYGGTGLGLAITERLCYMLGGSIRVNSLLDHGATFSVCLPIKSKKPQTTKKRWFSVGPKVNPKVIRFGHDDEVINEKRCKVSSVLVIDDDANIRDLMERFLTRQGFYAYTAASADEGIALAHKIKPDVITLDVMMPEKDGWWALTELKKSAALKDIPIVMMSLVEDKELGYALGASDYLTKPVEKETLFSTITKHVRMKEKLIAFVIQPDNHCSQTITSALEENNILAVCFEDNETAYSQLFAFHPDIIIIELHTPSGDSMRLMDRIRKNPRWQQIAIFVTTSGELSAAEATQFKDNIHDILYNNDQTGDEFLTNLKNKIVGCLRRKN